MTNQTFPSFRNLKPYPDSEEELRGSFVAIGLKSVEVDLTQAEMVTSLGVKVEEWGTFLQSASLPAW